MTREERIILINQYLIMKRLGVEDYSEKELSNKIEILSNGWSYLYDDEIFEIICEESDGSIEIEVHRILNMYRVINNAIQEYKLTNLSYYHQFIGFDGNEEGAHYGFMKFYINDMHRFEESKAVNSHHPTLHKYRAMLHEYNEIMGKKGRNKTKLTEEDVKRILDAEEKVLL